MRQCIKEKRKDTLIQVLNLRKAFLNREQKVNCEFGSVFEIISPLCNKKHGSLVKQG